MFVVVLIKSYSNIFTDRYFIQLLKLFSLVSKFTNISYNNRVCNTVNEISKCILQHVMDSRKVSTTELEYFHTNKYLYNFWNSSCHSFQISATLVMIIESRYMANEIPKCFVQYSREYPYNYASNILILNCGYLGKLIK